MLLNFKQLKTERGIDYSRDHLRRKCKAGEFPKPIQLSDRRICWLAEEVDKFIADRAAERDGQGMLSRSDTALDEPAALAAAPSE
jgi:predicted DNA-binding transcriptional regulator AlpA